jgi:HD-GYP domain-containing protein (c-di-GMP phosphodiesterase class II)
MKKSGYFYGILFICLVYFLVIYGGFVQAVDYKVYDGIKKIVDLNQQKKKSSVIIVDIDEKSLEALGQWPWSRIVLANLVQTIQKAHPASIGIDIFFPEEDKTSPKQILAFYQKFFSTKVEFQGLSTDLYDNDKVFAQVLQQSNVTLPVYLNSFKNHDNCIFPNQIQPIDFPTFLHDTRIMCSIPMLQKSASSVGFINAKIDNDGILRGTRLFRRYKKEMVPSFGLANLMSVDPLKIQGNTFFILGSTFKTGKDSYVLLNFYKNEHYKSISALDLLLGKVDMQSLQGKFIFIGASALGLYDRYTVSLSKNLPGVFVHATLIDNIINNDLIHSVDSFKIWNLAFSFLICLYLLTGIIQRKYLHVLIVFLVSNLIVILGYTYFLKQGLYLFLGYFLTPLEIFFFLISLSSLFLAYKERKSFFENLTKAHSSTLDSMALVAETRDIETGAHIKRTKEYIKLLADYLYKQGFYKDILTKYYREFLYRAAPLHDIGKVGIPDAILKKPARFTPQEFEIMKTHTTIGKDILENSMKENEENDFLKIAYNIAYYHHEKWDGSGYPCGLKKEEIPLEARLMALSDVYDALISRRCYKEGFSFEESEKIILEGKGTHFDPLLIDAFIVLKDEFKAISFKIKD